MGILFPETKHPPVIIFLASVQPALHNMYIIRAMLINDVWIVWLRLIWQNEMQPCSRLLLPVVEAKQVFKLNDVLRLVNVDTGSYISL